jgi:membrane-bound inhibitor of C-type lysozyme
MLRGICVALLLSSCALNSGRQQQFDCAGQSLHLNYDSSQLGLELRYRGQVALLSPIPSHSGTKYSDEQSVLTVATDNQSARWQFKTEPAIQCQLRH